MTRFPPYPTDILDRADALLSSKYPDGIVDPALVELLCRMAVEERERCAEIVMSIMGVQPELAAVAIEDAVINIRSAKAIRGME